MPLVWCMTLFSSGKIFSLRFKLIHFFPWDSGLVAHMKGYIFKLKPGIHWFSIAKERIPWAGSKSSAIDSSLLGIIVPRECQSSRTLWPGWQLLELGSNHNAVTRLAALQDRPRPMLLDQIGVYSSLTQALPPYLILVEPGPGLNSISWTENDSQTFLAWLSIPLNVHL